MKVYLPDEIQRALNLGAAMVVSISGGKDSQAIDKATSLIDHPGPSYSLHCDLGRIEWPESLPMCRVIAASSNRELVVVRRPQGDLVQEIEDRMDKLAGTNKPFWPSSASRYCTSDQKRDQADKELRNPKPFWPSSAARYCTSHHKTAQADKDYRQFSLVISVEGIRAQESPMRSKKQPVSIRQQITSSHYKGLTLSQALDEWERFNSQASFVGAAAAPRLAINWYPIFEWPEAQVYEYNGHSLDERNERRAAYHKGRIEEALNGWGMHPAYVYGNDRVSCVLCILASQNDLRVGGRHHPALLEHFIHLEEIGGSTFKNKWSLKELKE